MSLLFLTPLIIVILLILFVYYFFKQNKNIKRLEQKVKTQKLNTDYLIYLLRDLEVITGYGNDLRFVVDTISKSLESTYPHSAISSIYIRDSKLIFNSIAKEKLNSAFIDKIRDDMTANLNLNKDNRLELVKNITGELDDVSHSIIKSSADISITVNFKTMAIINISSTKPDQFSEDDKKIFNALSYLISGFLSKMEVLLKFEKSKSLAMIDSFTDGIFMVDMQKELIAINDSALALLKIQSNHPTLNDVLSALPNTYNFLGKIEQCIRENHQIVEDNITLSQKILKIVITPVHEINSDKSTQSARFPEVIGVSVLLHDITIEKSLSQMRDDFTNIMVHELRSPLTAIKASSEFLMSGADLTDEEKKRLIEMTSESSRKMLDKIALILDAAKMESGLFTIRKTDSDLKKLLTDRIAEFTQIAIKKSINFKSDIDPGIPVFAFDKVRIDEVVNNLLSNSLKFTPEHGSITLSARLSNDRVIVAVSDTGEGIPKDKQSKLFSKYQQAPAESDHVGTGLGLYVVKQVVEDHGGTVSLVSDVGDGTTISFTLPLHPLASTLPKMIGQTTKTPQKMVN